MLRPLRGVVYLGRGFIHVTPTKGCSLFRMLFLYNYATKRCGLFNVFSRDTTIKGNILSHTVSCKKPRPLRGVIYLRPCLSKSRPLKGVAYLRRYLVWSRLLKGVAYFRYDLVTI